MTITDEKFSRYVKGVKILSKYVIKDIAMESVMTGEYPEEDEIKVLSKFGWVEDTFDDFRVFVWDFN